MHLGPHLVAATWATCWLIVGPILPASAEALRVVETDGALVVRQGEQAVVTYNKVSPPVPPGMKPIYQRSGYLHPVRSPRGRVVTDTFPVDHPHQHGIYSAWVKTTYDGRTIDFWNLAGGSGRVLHERVVGTFERAGAAGFEVELLHRAENPPVDILRERWKVTLLPTDGTYYGFDLEIEQTAITPLPLVVDKFHYGGIALRGPTRWLAAADSDIRSQSDIVLEPSAFLNSLGSDRVAGNQQHAKWVALGGTIGGEPVSIAVLCHGRNFRAPQAARLHPTKPYFCFAPCVDGAFTIDREHPFAGRYRYLITDAQPDAAWLDQQWEQWCGTGADHEQASLEN